MRTQTWFLALSLSTLLSFACKREELELDPKLANGTAQTVGVGTIPGLNSGEITDQQKANQQRIADLDKAIAELNAKLANSKDLSVGEKAALEKSLASAQGERSEIIKKQKELEAKLQASERALEEARKKNEELRKQLEESGSKPDKPGTPIGGEPVDPRISTDSLGPFSIQQLQLSGLHNCFGPSNDSTLDGAVIEARPCTYKEAQTFMLEKVADAGTGAYRAVISHSKKCLSISGDGKKIGDLLVQRPCTRDGNLKEVFFLTGVNGSGDFLLQPTINGSLCFNVQGDKTVAQGICDDRSHVFQIFDIEE